MAPLHAYWPVALAPFIGSFLTVLVARLPGREGVVWGRSRCDSCAHALGALDLLPIASWLASRGRCRYCSEPIPWFHLALELAAVGVAVWSTLAMTGLEVWLGCGLAWILLALAAVDLHDGLLPDLLTAPLLVGGLAAALLTEDDPAGHVIGAAAGFAALGAARALYLRLRGRDGLGLGDAKLLAAGGAWVSWQGLPSVLLLACGIALGSVLIMRWRGLPVTLDRPIPFGPALCLGIWLVWLYGPVA